MSNFENDQYFARESEALHQESVYKTAKQYRNEQYAEAQKYFEVFNQLNVEYQEALQAGNSEKVAEILVFLQHQDLRAEGEKIQKEADRVYEEEKAAEDVHLQNSVDRIRAAMASIGSRQAA